MRRAPNLLIEPYRIRTGFLASDQPAGNNGAFWVPFNGVELRIIASDGLDPAAEGWEHVSVSLAHRCPTWEEMSHVKGLFWRDEETVIQFHPPQSVRVNFHPFCLHLWRNREKSIPLPPTVLIGPTPRERQAT